MRIAIIGQDNGPAGGLTVDRQILTALFTSFGHKVSYVHRQSHATERVDLNVYLESFAEAAFEQQRTMSTYGICVPNLEWLPPRQTRWLSSMTQIWAKSQGALAILRANGLTNAVFSGFAGRDRYSSAIRTRATKTCAHVQGQSSMKGTSAILEAWSMRGNIRLPPLVVISSFGSIARQAHNVTMVRGPVSEDKMVELMNGSLIHLCPSRAEGFGHTLAEAASCMAAVITIDESPMNEHVTPESGLLMKTSSSSEVHETLKGTRFSDVTPAAIVDAVDLLCRRSTGDLNHMGALARERFLQRNAAFATFARDALEWLA